MQITNTIKNPLAGIVYCSKCGRAMVRRPYQKRGQEDSLLCPYTSCSTVSSKLSLVEKVLLDGIKNLVDEYKLSSDVPKLDIDNVITLKEKLIEEKEAELKKLDAQKLKQYDLLEQGVYTTDVFLERSKSTAASIEACIESIKGLREEIEHDKKLVEQQAVFIPKCENLLENYWEFDAQTRNKLLRELIEKVNYTKESKNYFLKGDEITFLLDIFPKIQ